MGKYTNMKYRTSWATAMKRRMRVPLARAAIRNFLKRSITPRKLVSMNFLGGGKTYSRRRFRMRRREKGDTALCRQTVLTAIYNPTPGDNNVHWVNGEPGGTLTDMPFAWNLWNSSGTYVTPGVNISCSTETGGSAVGAAGEIVRGRIRTNITDTGTSADLAQWEWIKLKYVSLNFQYQCTDYSAGTNANGLVPTLQYVHDNDLSLSAQGIMQQLSPVELERRPTCVSRKLYRGKVVTIKIRPGTFAVTQSDMLGGFTTGKRIPLGWIDPRSGSIAQNLSNLQFQIRNLQLPGGTADTKQTSMVRVWAKYHFECRNFIGATEID